MASKRTTENGKPNLIHIAYNDAGSLGSELDDFENCYREWVNGAVTSKAIPPSVLDKLCNEAISGNGKVKLIILLDADTTRFVGFFLAYADGYDLRVPMVNWHKSISDDYENAIIAEIIRFAFAYKCTTYFITSLPFQSRLRNAVRRSGGRPVMEVMRMDACV